MIGTYLMKNVIPTRKQGGDNSIHGANDEQVVQ